jgi:hypothetical protein
MVVEPSFFWTSDGCRLKGRANKIYLFRIKNPPGQAGGSDHGSLAIGRRASCQLYRPYIFTPAPIAVMYANWQGIKMLPKTGTPE